jgi:hypothetical protein
MPLDSVAVLPERAVSFEGMQKVLGKLNAPFVADFLSQALMHEQCGRHLYRAVAGQTMNPMLKRRYEEYGKETENHIVVLQDLITALGGDPGYVSPSARATEKLDTGTVEATFAIDGSVDLMTKELLMLDAVVLAETVDHANWKMIEQIGGELDDGTAGAAFDAAVSEVLPQEDQHIMWASQTRKRMIAMQATSPVTAGVVETAEQVMSRVTSWFDGDSAA